MVVGPFDNRRVERSATAVAVFVDFEAKAGRGDVELFDVVIRGEVEDILNQSKIKQIGEIGGVPVMVEHARDLNHLFRFENDGTGRRTLAAWRGGQDKLTCVGEDFGLDGRDLYEQVDKDRVGIVRRLKGAGRNQETRP